MSLQLHRPDGRGSVEPRRAVNRNWRGQLTNPRWGAALRKGELPELKNPEMNPTPRWLAVLFWLGLGVATFLILVLGYGVGFWQFR